MSDVWIPGITPLYGDEVRAVERREAEIDRLTDENARLRANQRTPGTSEYCAYVSCKVSKQPSAWAACDRVYCPIIAAAAALEPKKGEAI